MLVGTVPKATVEDVRRAFAIAKGYRRSSRATSATTSAGARRS
jgi:hypothetical protein